MALWNPNQVLDLYYGPTSHTCSGTTQKGLRCRQNMIRRQDRAEAVDLLDLISEYRPETIRKEVYERLAYLTLCPRWHRDKPGHSQVAQVAHQFQTRVQRFVSEQASTSREPVRPQPQPQTNSNVQSSTSGGRRVLTSGTVSSTASPSVHRLSLVQLSTPLATPTRSTSVLNTLSDQDILDLTPEELEAVHRADAARRRLRDLNRARNQSHQPQAQEQRPLRLVPLVAEPSEPALPSVPLLLPWHPDTATTSRVDHTPTEPRPAPQQPQFQALQTPQSAPQSRPRPQVAVQATPITARRIQAVPVQAVPVLAAPVQAAPVQAVPVQAVPVQTVPVQAVPVQAVPVQAVPVQAVPVQAMPVQAMPVQVVPVQERLQDVPQPRSATSVQPPPPAPVVEGLEALPQPRPLTPAITTTRVGPHPRKSLTDPCPVCLDDLDLSNSVYCRGQCGTNVHRTCFSEWRQQCLNSWDARYGGIYEDVTTDVEAERRPRREESVTCIFCRGRWVEESDDRSHQA